MGKIQPKILAAFTAVLVLVLAAGFALWPRTDPSVAKPVEISASPSIAAESESASPSPSLSPTPSQAPSPSATSAESTSSAPASPSTSAAASPPSKQEQSTQSSNGGKKNSAALECSAASRAFTPSAFTIDRVGAHERVLAMGLQNGIVPAPPMNDRRSAAWWKDGPAPGDGQGKVVLTIHTYRPSLAPALGNELYASGKSALQPGDIVKLHGKNGEIQCYEFTEAPKIFTDEYDEDSTVMLDDSGPESLVIVICWDFNKKTKDWDSRVMFQFKAVT